MSFQTLPELVIRSIIDYIIPKETGSSSPTQLEEARIWRLAVEAFNTCHGWRTVGKPYLCKRYYMCIESPNDSSSAALEPWSSAIGMPPNFDFVNMVNVVSITVKLAAIFDGTAAGFINTQHKMFGSARTLSINIFGPPSKSPDLDGNRTFANLNEFICCIQQLVPNLSWITIRSNFQHWYLCQKNKHQTYTKVISLLIRLAKKSVRIGFPHEAAQLDFNSDLDARHDLSHIEFSDAAGEKHLTLVRFYAKSLTSLTFQFASLHDIRGLIYDRKTDQYVVYENLLFFKSTARYPHSRPILPSFDQDAVPFPKLETFLSPNFYPFHDDTLFRGNSGSLKKVDMYLYPYVAYVLINHHVFTRNQFRALSDLRFRDRAISKKVTFALVAEMSKYAKSLSYCNDTKDEYISAYVVIPWLDKLASIRKLDFETTYFDLDQLYSLLSKLQRLIHLRCGICDEESGDTNMEKYDQVNRNFRQLQLSFVKGTSAKRLLNIFNVLRRLCPNLKSVKTEFNLHEHVDGLIEDMEGFDVNEIQSRNSVY